MKKYLTYAMAAFFATTLFSMAAAPDNAAIEAKENAAWQAFKDKKADDFKKVVDKDFVGVYDVGIVGMAEEMTDMQKWDMKSFKIDGFKAFSDEKDVMVTTYTVTVTGTYDGKDASGTFNAGSVWKMEDGQWLAIFHTNVKQAAAAK